jgi:KDO2-lipid IV(A) lauroyltransferase
VAKRKLYRYPLYLLARLAAIPVYVVPRRWVLSLAGVAGRIAYLILSRQREKILGNLRRAFGSEKSEAEIRKIARGVVENAAKTAVEILQFPKFNSRNIDGFIDVSDALHLLGELRKDGRGIICLTAHIGNWELLAGALCLKGIPMTVVGRRIYYEPYNRWIVGIRQSVKMRLFYRDQSARELLACLKRNEVVGLLPDQDIDSLAGMWVDFFGRPAYTPTAPVKMALKLETPLAIGFLIRFPGDRYKLVIEEVIRPKVETTFEDAVKKYTIQWMGKFEKVIRDYPEQWMWMHDRWKTQPPKESPMAEKRGEVNQL